MWQTQYPPPMQPRHRVSTEFGLPLSVVRPVRVWSPCRADHDFAEDATRLQPLLLPRYLV